MLWAWVSAVVMVSRFCCLEDAQGHIQTWRNLNYNFRCLKLRSLIYVHHHSHWRNNSAEQFFTCSSMVGVRTWRITSGANQAINPSCWRTSTVWQSAHEKRLCQSAKGFTHSCPCTLQVQCDQLPWNVCSHQGALWGWSTQTIPTSSFPDFRFLQN